MNTGSTKKTHAKKFIPGEYCAKTSKAFALFTLTILLTLIAAASFAQNVEDTTDGRFHDDLFNRLVGKWDVTSIAHGSPFTAVFEANWVMNHQYLHIHFKSNEIIPWFHTQMEFEEFIGYNHSNKRYVVHGMSIEGDEDPSEGFGYAYRTGNEFKTVAKFGLDSLIVQRFALQTAYREITHADSWNIKSAWVIAGQEGEPFLEMQLVPATPSSK